MVADGCWVRVNSGSFMAYQEIRNSQLGYNNYQCWDSGYIITLSELAVWDTLGVVEEPPSEFTS